MLFIFAFVQQLKSCEPVEETGLQNLKCSPTFEHISAKLNVVVSS